jgi:hypothetical protein
LREHAVVTAFLLADQCEYAAIRWRSMGFRESTAWKHVIQVRSEKRQKIVCKDLVQTSSNYTLGGPAPATHRTRMRRRRPSICQILGHCRIVRTPLTGFHSRGYPSRRENKKTPCGLPRLLTVLGCADAAKVFARYPSIVESYAPH